MLITKVDYTLSGNHSVFGRLEYQKQDSPASVSDHTFPCSIRFSPAVWVG